MALAREAGACFLEKGYIDSGVVELRHKRRMLARPSAKIGSEKAAG